MTFSTDSPTFAALAALLAVVYLPAVFDKGAIDAVSYLGSEPEWRESEDSVKNAILIVDPSQRAAEDGFVTAWNVYTTRGRRTQYVHLQVWRPAGPPDTRYRFVGETFIQALWVGHSVFTLQPRDRIAVRRGDTIGIYFQKYNPIPWSPVPCRQGLNEHLFKYNPYGGGSSALRLPVSTNTTTFREITFDRAKLDWDPCRQYSLNATIMDDIEVARYDYDYQETTDGRYLRRPYGMYRPTEDRSLRSGSVPKCCSQAALFHQQRKRGLMTSSSSSVLLLVVLLRYKEVS